MIDWVDAMCRSWGYGKRRLLGIPNTIEDIPKDGIPISGPAKSLLGRIKEERVGAGDRTDVERHPMEVLLGDALTVAIAVNFAIQAGHLNDRCYEVSYAHYVLRGPAFKKWQQLRIRRRYYYEMVHHFNVVLARWIPSVANRSDNLREVI